MRRDPKALAAIAAAAALIAAVLQLVERDWIRGATGLAIAATFIAIATDLHKRSQAARWLAYGFVSLAFVLLGVRLFN